MAPRQVEVILSNRQIPPWSLPPAVKGKKKAPHGTEGVASSTTRDLGPRRWAMDLVRGSFSGAAGAMRTHRCLAGGWGAWVSTQSREDSVECPPMP